MRERVATTVALTGVPPRSRPHWTTHLPTPPLRCPQERGSNSRLGAARRRSSGVLAGQARSDGLARDAADHVAVHVDAPERFGIVLQEERGDAAQVVVGRNGCAAPR